MKLTEIMKSGLVQMQNDCERKGFSWGFPTASTGQALARRGLVDVVQSGAWPKFYVNDEGKRVIAEIKAERGGV